MPIIPNVMRSLGAGRAEADVMTIGATPKAPAAKAARRINARLLSIDLVVIFVSSPVSKFNSNYKREPDSNHYSSDNLFNLMSLKRTVMGSPVCS